MDVREWFCGKVVLCLVPLATSDLFKVIFGGVSRILVNTSSTFASVYTMVIDWKHAVAFSRRRLRKYSSYTSSFNHRRWLLKSYSNSACRFLFQRNLGKCIRWTFALSWPFCIPVGNVLAALRKKYCSSMNTCVELMEACLVWMENLLSLSSFKCPENAILNRSWFRWTPITMSAR